jgi:type I restriction enzyme, S subunit
VSRLDELIEEACPHGVDYEPLGALVQPVTNVKWSDVGEESFQYIDLSSVDRVTHAIGHTETITFETAPSRA